MHSASPITVRFGPKLVKLSVTERQANAIAVAAERVGMDVSAWIRDMVEHARGEHPLEIAAALSGLAQSAWIREVAVAAAAVSPLKVQLTRAWKRQRELKGPRAKPRARMEAVIESRRKLYSKV